MFNIFKESWIYLGCLSIALYGYAIYAFAAKEPFFLGTDLLKHKPTEWLYENIGATGTAIVFLLLGAAFSYWSISEYKKAKKHNKSLKERDRAGRAAP